MKNSKVSRDPPQKRGALFWTGLVLTLTILAMQMNARDNIVVKIRTIINAESDKLRSETWVALSIDLIVLGIGVVCLAVHFLNCKRKR